MLSAKFSVPRGKLLYLILLFAKCANDADARQVVAHGTVHSVEFALNAAIERDPRRHDRHDYRDQKRKRRQKNERRARVGHERHRRRAEHDDGRTKKDAERHVHARLNLVDVACHARDHGSRPRAVYLRIGKGLQLRKQTAAQFRGSPHRSARRKILRREGKRQSHDAERCQNETAVYDIRFVPVGNAVIDDRLYHERNKQFHAGFE